MMESESITINLQMRKLCSVKTFSLQRFVAPATQSCKILKNYCTKNLINSELILQLLLMPRFGV